MGWVDPWVVLGWVGSGHTKWTHGQLWAERCDSICVGRRRAPAGVAAVSIDRRIERSPA